MFKVIRFLIIILFSLTFFVNNAFAQEIYQSNRVTTRIGNPVIPLGDLGIILNWSERINDALQQGRWGYFNKMMANISNGSYSAVKRQGINETTDINGLYWCTNIVIDSYNLAGKKGLGSNPNHQAVVDMRKFWKTTSGYIHLDYLNLNHQTILNQVKPGYAVFFEQNPGKSSGREHVAIVKTIQLDSQGYGQIETYDSNSSQKINKYPIREGHVKNTMFGPNGLVGFGGI